ncbi:MAG: glycosyltransferase family 2 protein [Gammaproteobacteria bacterium]|nr:glycosyltransferase family 2 protein [Gammaproteobacteria bacterium]
MTERAPLVTVAIPVYNVELYICKAVESVLAQDYVHKEILIVDDGSTDGTAEALGRYGNRIKVLRQSNRGLSGARNAGIQAARGKYVAFLDADDYWLPGKLREQVNLLERHPEIGFCSTATRVENESGEEIRTWDCCNSNAPFLWVLFERHSAVAGSGSAVAARRVLLEKAGGFDETLAGLEDIDMWMRLAAITEYRCIKKELAVVRWREKSLSRDLYVMRASAIRVMKKNRHLLEPRLQGRFWNACYAGMLSDYAKWEARAGYRLSAVMHLLEGFARAPIAKGRMLMGILLAAMTGKL